MDINTLDIFSYLHPMTVGLCLCIGYIIKYSIPQIPNRLIPLIMGVIGIIFSWVSHIPVANAPDAMSVVYSGLVSGLASTGLHQAFSQMINRDKNEDNKEDDV